MDQWLKSRLSKCLDFDIPEDMIRYILSIKTASEIDEYFQTLLNYEIEDHYVFLNDFKQKRFNKSKNQKQVAISNLNSKDKYNGDKSNDNKEFSKKKTRYTNLYNQDGKISCALIPGRHHCDCQATRHKLINNCFRCGRIICMQEGSGPCLFCGYLVCSEEESKLIKSLSKKGENLKKTLMEQNRPKGWEEALAQRNRLIEFDKTSEKRTTVIDDESDYFKTNSVWLSEIERKKLISIAEQMHSKKHKSRMSRKITIDFSGREIAEEPSINLNENILTESSEALQPIQKKNVYTEETSNQTHPYINCALPIYIHPEIGNTHQKNKSIKYSEFDGVYNRIQDKELLEVQDMGFCLSMHQPWASLLVLGIKKHEGRAWYTSHRGRLWIASTTKVVNAEEINNLEYFYKNLYNDEQIIFPKQYPSGALLGCVLLQDCLPQEEYRKIYPNGESESPFVFICASPKELNIKFPIKGQHKIYKLDHKIHMAASRSLQQISNNR